MSIKNLKFELDGLELLRLIQKYVDRECDDLHLQKFSPWKSVLESRASGKLDENEFQMRAEQLKIRSYLRSNSAIRDFINSLPKEEK